MNLSSLRTIAKNTIRLSDEAERDPLRFFRPTAVQLSFLKDTNKIVMLRGGNQIGKTLVGSVETVYRLLGNHPWKRVPPPPIEAWIICHSWEQSKIIMCKFHEYVPKHELHPDVEFVDGKGYRATGAPVVRFKNGSVLRFKTTNQAGGNRGTIGLASGSVDWILLDEPPPANIFGEILGRTTRTKGSIGITMTPVGVPVDYLKKLVEDGVISEHVGKLTVENTWPIGLKSPMMSQQEIDQLANSYLPLDRDARINGDWDGGIPDGRIFENFTKDLISDLKPVPTYRDKNGVEQEKQFVWSIGIDHGHDVSSQVAVLVAVDITDQTRPIVFCVDEYVASGAGADVHAKGIIAMLRRNDLEIAHIHRWTGDRAHGGSNNGGRMSNQMLTAAFAHVLGYPRDKLPFRIRTAYKPKYSVYYGTRVLHELMSDSRFQVFPACKQLIKSLTMWTLKKSGYMDPNSPHKHSVDALRYATMPIVDVQYRTPKQSKVFINK